jgi:hypothetical protein
VATAVGAEVGSEVGVGAGVGSGLGAVVGVGVCCREGDEVKAALKGVVVPVGGTGVGSVATGAMGTRRSEGARA